jgi:hypothetical protein
MKQISILVIFNLFFISLNAQTFNEKVSDNLINEFLREYLDGFSQQIENQYHGVNFFVNKPISLVFVEKLEKNINDWNSVFDNSETNIDSLFNLTDKYFMISQLKTQKDYFWKIEHENFQFDTVIEYQSDKEYFRLSMPVFSENLEIVIIRRVLECGFDCGDQWIGIYKKVKNKWKLVSAWGYVI